MCTAPNYNLNVCIGKQEAIMKRTPEIQAQQENAYEAPKKEMQVQELDLEGAAIKAAKSGAICRDCSDLSCTCLVVDGAKCYQRIGIRAAPVTKSTEAMANSTEGEAVRTAEVRLEQTVAEASVLVKPKVVDASKRTGSNAAVTGSRSGAGADVRNIPSVSMSADPTAAVSGSRSSSTLNLAPRSYGICC